MKKLLPLCLLFTQVAAAQTFDYSEKWGFGGAIGRNAPVFGNPLNKMADSDTIWDLHVRYHLCKTNGLELSFARHELSDTNIAAKVTDVLWFHRLSPTSRLTPIVGAGAGVVDLSNYSPNSLKLGLKLRTGLEYALNEAFSLGLNLDYQHINKMLFTTNLPTRNGHIVAGRVGVTWYFGKAATAAAAVVAKTMTPELDSDKDGIFDKKDKCPGTAEGVSVNAYGCAKAEKAMVKLNVHFASGKTAINSSYDNDLKEIALFMKEHPKTKIQIQGHTDNTGSKVLNKNLSVSRANAVKNYLVTNLGADSSRLDAVGFGDEQPIANNNTESGKQENRRVIAVITE